MSRPLDALAREHTELAVETAVAVMKDRWAENKDKLRAADMILDRGHGKPLTATISLPATRRAALAMAQLSDEDLMAQIQSSPLPRLARGEQRGETYEAEALDPLLA